MSAAELQKLRVVDLRARLKEAGLATSGRKSELVDRLVAAQGKAEDEEGQAEGSSSPSPLPAPSPTSRKRPHSDSEPADVQDPPQDHTGLPPPSADVAAEAAASGVADTEEAPAAVVVLDAAGESDVEDNDGPDHEPAAEKPAAGPPQPAAAAMSAEPDPGQRARRRQPSEARQCQRPCPALHPCPAPPPPAQPSTLHPTACINPPHAPHRRACTHAAPVTAWHQGAGATSCAAIAVGRCRFEFIDLCGPAAHPPDQRRI